MEREKTRTEALELIQKQVKNLARSVELLDKVITVYTLKRRHAYKKKTLYERLGRAVEKDNGEQVKDIMWRIEDEETQAKRRMKREV